MQFYNRCIFISLLVGCASFAFGAQYKTPTEKVPTTEWPYFTDDLNFNGLKTAIQRQLSKFAQIDMRGTIQFGAENYPLSRVRDSLIEFGKIVSQYQSCHARGTKCINRFNSVLRSKFSLYRPRLRPGDPRYGEDHPTFFTGYYTPLMNVTKSPQTGFQHAIYARPANPKLRQMSRDQIDFKGVLSHHHLELFYASDLFNLYLMQIEGGGHLLVHDGGKTSSQYISYAGENGLKLRFISNYMLNRHYISNSSIAAQRQYLNSHPERQEEIYSTCPAYVYYKLSKTPPEGSGNVPLTNNRSIATDDRYYAFKGVLSFVSSSRPVPQSPESTRAVQFQPFSRFYLDQDTGGAIRGKARVDLYFGEGDYAELAAYNESQRGDLYFLMLK